MKHLDAEVLSLLALGENVGSAAQRSHLGTCPDCSERFAGLRQTVRIATTELHGDLETPGSHNWAAIYDALALSPEVAADPLARPSAAGTRAGLSEAGPRPATVGPGSGRPLTSQSRSRQWIAHAAAGLLIGAAAAWTIAGISGPAQPPAAAPVPPPVVLAETPLQPLAAYAEGGDALVEQLSDGMRQLVVRLPDSNAPGFREVWMASADLSRMVSVGVLGGGSGAFVIPAGLDLGQYPVVDISIEPYDGDPAHSADSIARGQFTAQRPSNAAG